MKSLILTQVRLTQTTLASSRNILDLIVPTDLSAVDRINNATIGLAANNNLGNNADSETLLGAVEKFLHLSCSQEVEVTLRRTISGVPTNLPIMVARHLTITGDFTEVKIKNTNTTDPATIKAIYA